jgi:hypothetical protein
MSNKKFGAAAKRSMIGIGIASMFLIGGAEAAGFNTPGDVLISDQFNNRVIEEDPSGNIVWTFGDTSYIAGPTSVVAPNDAERVGKLTLISGTGAPAGAETWCPNGCADNRVLLVDENANIVWQYGEAGVSGAGAGLLNAPVCAAYLPTGNILITDQGNQRIIEVTPEKQIVWQYGENANPGSAANQLNNPNSAELLDNGDVLIADESNNRVIEVTQAKQVVWQYGSVTNTVTLNAPAFASRLSNGDTLIADSGNNRVVEIDANKNVVFTYYTNKRPGSVTNPIPTRAIRLKNGNTLISDQANDQVIEITPTGHIVESFGTIGVAGIGDGWLNWPYDAKVVGDYTGLVSPFPSAN